MAWMLGFGGVTCAVRVAAQRAGARPDPGVTTFGWLVLAVLIALLLAVPSLARPVGAAREDHAIAGARAREVVLGELAAAGVVIAALLGTALPSVLATVAMGGVGIGHLVRVLAVLWLVLACVAAIAQCGGNRAVAGVAILCWGTLGVYHLAETFRWRKACAAANIADIKLHDLRHYYASGHRPTRPRRRSRSRRTR